MEREHVVLFGCGDVGPIHEPVSAYTTLVRSTLASADIRVGQCERVYSERGALQLHSGGAHSRVKPHMASIFSDCGFDIVSVASNHALDWGPDALLDTIEVLQKRGIKTVGAGRNLHDARQPAIIRRNGVTVAVLAYCSVLPEGYAAGPDKPGVAPVRVHTYYEPREYQPGVPPRIVTLPHQQDLDAMVSDIAAAKQAAHAVVLSLHWGVHFIPRLIAEYQPLVAEAAFAAGADLILGHHAHVPKAIAVHDNKVCFYSLSNFIMSAPEKSSEKTADFAKRFGVTVDPDYPRLGYGADAKRSLIAKAELTADGVKKVSFLPVLIDKQLRPEVLHQGDARFDDAVAFMDWASEDFDHRLTVERNEVVIGSTKPA